MNKTTYKSIVAILAGFLLGAFLSIATDFLLDLLGIMSMENFKQAPFTIIVVVILYRCIYNSIGCYVTAKLAPGQPMKHVLIIGIIGTVLSIGGSVAMWDKAIPFYNMAIILTALPSALLGGLLFLKTQNNDKTKN